ncbi:hypothetical protein OHA25_30885 [Nonomuraea sp. NBC_00507]|uniref:hypothetical protein n=1 Tax=Nonomuraea sp. NBC_00507 TaxID=2976002 RepID=UPI002E185E5A
MSGVSVRRVVLVFGGFMNHVLVMDRLIGLWSPGLSEPSAAQGLGLARVAHRPAADGATNRDKWT